MARYLTLNTARKAASKGPKTGKVTVFMTKHGKPVTAPWGIPGGRSIRIPEKVGSLLDRVRLTNPIEMDSQRVVTESINIIDEAGGGVYPEFVAGVPTTWDAFPEEEEKPASEGSLFVCGDPDCGCDDLS